MNDRMFCRYAAYFDDALNRKYQQARDESPEAFIDRLLASCEQSIAAEDIPEREKRIEAACARLAAEKSLNQFVAGAPVVAQEPNGLGRRGRIIAMLVFTTLAVAYLALNLDFNLEGWSADHASFESKMDGQLALDIGVVDFEEANIVVHMVPVAGKMIGEDGMLIEDVTLETEGGDGSVSHTFLAHEPLKPFSQRVEIDSGDILSYPFDRYVAELEIKAFSAGGPIAFSSVLRHVPHGLSALLIEDTEGDEMVADFLHIRRAASAEGAILMVILSLILVTFAAAAISWNVVLHGRKLEFGMLIWTAALLFAIPSIRKSLPGSPPMGAEIDFLVFFWLQATVAASIVALVFTWVKRPG